MLLFAASDSSAQTHWVKYAVPVLSRSASFPDWKAIAVSDAFVMQDADTLKMWYAGSGWLNTDDDCPHVRIGYAWSLDGITWSEYSDNPVLDIGSDPGDFDYDGVETPCVVKDLTAPASHRYKLWYAGRNARCLPLNDHQIGYAYSADGIHWTKYTGNPVLSAGDADSWYNTFVSNPEVIMENDTCKMWFTAPDLVINGQPTDGKGNIGYATSMDGMSWTVHPEPVLIAGDQENWDSASIAEPSVVKAGGLYHMWYSALNQWEVENFQVGYASSSDGVNWVKSIQNPVLQTGDTGEWDSYWATHPGVIYDVSSDKFRMWYTGRDTDTIESLTGYYWDIGYAESSPTDDIQGYNNFATAVRIYPNPVQSELHLELAPGLANLQLKIYNAQGALIYAIADTGRETLDIQVNRFPAGIYFISLETSLGKYHLFFIVR